MALNANTSTALITNFKGSTPAVDPEDVDPSHGLYCQNCDFLLGQTESVQVSMRRGTGQVAQFPVSTGAVPSMDSWYFSSAGVENCYAVYYSTTQGVLAWDQLHQAFTGVLVNQANATAAVFAFDGSRMYVAFQNSSGRGGFAGGQVFDVSLVSGDPLFPYGIPITVPLYSLAQVVSGGFNNITKGAHRVVVFYTSRNGFFGPLLETIPSYAAEAGTAFRFAEDVVVNPNDSLQVYLNLTSFSSLPTWLQGATLSVAMSPVTNPNRFFLVPGITTPLPPTGFTTLIFTIGISDNDLVEGAEVTQNADYFGSAPQANFPEFLPSAIFQYSSRMGYITQDSSGFPVIYFSQQNAFQSVSRAFGGIYLEGKQIPVMGVSLGGVCYIATLSGLYSTQDNGDVPSTWTPPAHVDGSVGVLAPSCIITAGGKVLIASEKGLYLFRGGAFPQIPISYWQSTDWNRINWMTPWQVQVVDDSYDKVLRVLAPLRTLVSGASNTDPIVITTAIPHLIADKAAVSIAGVFGNTAANGSQFITRIDDYNFSIPAAGNGAYTFGGTITPFNANAIMTWAYPEGDAPGEVFYSIQGFLAYTAGTMATVRNINTGVDEVWFSRAVPTGGNSGFMIRRFLPTDAFTLTTQGLYQDVTWNGAQAAIPAIYETSLLPGSQDEAMTIRDHHGAHFRVTGEGALNIQVATLDHATVITPIPSQIILSPKPGMEILRKWFLRNEDISIIFSMTGLFSYFNLALVRAYYTNSLPQR